MAGALIPATLTAELTELKLRLAEMVADELPADQASLLAQEISAIRLHLKRLALERNAISEHRWIDE